MRFRVGSISTLTPFFLIFMVFRLSSFQTLSEKDEVFEEMKKCNGSTSVQMVNIKFSSHVVKNGMCLQACFIVY